MASQTQFPTPEYKLPMEFFRRNVEDVAAEIIGRFLIVESKGSEPVAAQLTQVAAYQGSEKSTAPTMNYAPGMIGISVKHGHRLIDIACGTPRNPSCITLRAGIVYRPNRTPEVIMGPGLLSKAIGFGDHMDSTPISSERVWFAGQSLPEYMITRVRDSKNTTPNHKGTFVMEPRSVEHLLADYVRGKF
ncbi:MAG TPA: DNA-3-methyladenine glycosylase [Acidobacteriota bacterium]|nr:DNA-3-methyladenine glycosylase [Acidobacteriota bacterium]